MRDGSETKEKIERAALTLFVKRGIAETSIRQIAKAAHVSLGAMYNHYKSKDELAEVLFAELFHRIGAELERLAEGKGLFPARLKALVGHVFASVERDQAAVTYLIRTRQEYTRRVRPGDGNPFLAFRNLIARAIEAGELPKQDATVAAAMIVGAINQVVELFVAGRVKAAPDALAATVSSAVLRLLGG
ncbi:MAG TPA: TetR/AcrR family transcriptional regulator [Alphaproteobacteria bacterium]|jgi:AcrR family transcriptional regulator